MHYSRETLPNISLGELPDSYSKRVSKIFTVYIKNNNF